MWGWKNIIKLQLQAHSRILSRFPLHSCDIAKEKMKDILLLNENWTIFCIQLCNLFVMLILWLLEAFCELQSLYCAADLSFFK